jgi:TonB family protein
MFTDPLFRAAFAVSLVAHIAVIAPAYFTSNTAERQESRQIELNYILINDASIAMEEELYSSDQDEDAVESSEQDRFSDITVMDSPSQQEVHLSEEIRAASQDTQQREKAYLEYFNLIREKIRARVYSSSASSEEGVVEVVFTVSSDGRLVYINKADTTLSRGIKKSVINAMRRAQPFPPFPQELGNRPITFSLAIKFSS